MYILTKRGTQPDGTLWHAIYGYTHSPGEARAWFRAAHNTDVVEIQPAPLLAAEKFKPWAQLLDAEIGQNRRESWGEQSERDKKLIDDMMAKAIEKARRP